MFTKAIDSLVQILHNDGFTNLVVNDTIKNNSFTDYEKKLYTKLVYGVVENKLLIDYLVQPLTKGKRIKPFLKNAIRIGVYGIDFLNIKDHHLVNNLVQVVKKKDYKGSTFLNAILRTYQTTKRRSINTGNKLLDYSIKYSINLELVELLAKQYPNDIEDILTTKHNSSQVYRINTIKTTTTDIEKYLKELQIEYIIKKEDILITKESLINDKLFIDGLIVAQDLSSIEVGKVLNPKENSTILDMCSAPGSKTMHIAAIMKNTGKIIASDIYEHKIKLINDNAKKLGVTNVTTVLQDGKTSNYNELFDYILADVPCSGLGVIYHKPDIKYQMNLEKIDNIKKEQKQIVENGLKQLKPNGIFVYSTCTINKEENNLFIEQLLIKHPYLKVLEEYSYLPSETRDGFYICKMLNQKEN